MSNEIKITIPKDFNKIDANNLSEFIWWIAHLNISPEKLLAITEKIGNSTVKVRKYLEDDRKSLT